LFQALDQFNSHSPGGTNHGDHWIRQLPGIHAFSPEQMKKAPAFPSGPYGVLA
jgi:hypothetical protein